MLPVLFSIGEFPVRSFGVLLLVGFLVAIWCASRRAPEFGLTAAQIQDAAIWVIFAGILGARLAFVAQNWDYFGRNPDEIIKLQMDGLTSFGGLIGGAVAIAIFARVKKVSAVRILDTVGVPTLLAHAIGRVGCFLNGCCFGHATATSPPGVAFVGQQGLFLPAQLYDAAMTLAGAVVVLQVERRRPLVPGVPLAWALGVYGASRFIYEIWRSGVTGESLLGLPITQAQGVSLLMMLGAGVLGTLARRRATTGTPASPG